MFFHQAHNSVGNDIYNAFFYRDIQWLAHLHKAYEAAIVLSGEAELTLGEKKLTLKEGDSALISPYQLHSYHTEKSSLVFIVVFSSGYIDAFARQMSGKEADNGVFRLSDTTFEFIKQGLFTVDAPSRDTAEAPKPSTLTVKACLYAFAAEANEKVTFVEKKRNDALIYDIIDYVEKNYTEDVSLKSMADKLGYDYRYLSRVFNETMGVNFKTFINQYRCDMVKSLIEQSDMTLSEIAMGSGFQSIRTFNRVFKQVTGRAPSELYEVERK